MINSQGNLPRLMLNLKLFVLKIKKETWLRYIICVEKTYFLVKNSAVIVQCISLSHYLVGIAVELVIKNLCEFTIDKHIALDSSW